MAHIFLSDIIALESHTQTSAEDTGPASLYLRSFSFDHGNKRLFLTKENKKQKKKQLRTTKLY